MREGFPRLAEPPAGPERAKARAAGTATEDSELTNGSNERRVPSRTEAPGTTQPFSGERSIQPEALPDDARDLLARSEKLVYLFPEGFDSARLVESFFSDAAAIGFEAHVIPDSRIPHTFLGHAGNDRFAVEVRPRSATIIADPFGLRRDLLLVVKECVLRARREETTAPGRASPAA